MTDTAVHFRDMAVAAGGATILRLEDFRIPRGQFVALLGPNGAGKTTLLRCCMGAPAWPLRWSFGPGGGASSLGRDLHGLRGGALAALRRRVGYVRQTLPTGGETPLTVREVVAIGCTGRRGLLRPLGRADWAAVDDWMGRLGIAELAGRRFSELSGGQQRKTLIARAMAQQPELLLLDEPAANLDLGWRERIVALLDELFTEAAGALTVALVCHELEALPACCRRAAVLDGGRVVADGDPRAIFDETLVRRLYGPGLEVLRRGGRLSVIPATPPPATPPPAMPAPAAPPPATLAPATPATLATPASSMTSAAPPAGSGPVPPAAPPAGGGGPQP